MLVLEDLVFAYPDQSVPYRFSMTAEAGVVTAVTGASGSGKSTLLDLIAGFLQPQSGSIRLDDTELLPLPPEARPVSVLFQSETLFEHLSAAHNVALGLPAGTRRRETARRVETGADGGAAERQLRQVRQAARRPRPHAAAGSTGAVAR